jgi:hypothetical protein
MPQCCKRTFPLFRSYVQDEQLVCSFHPGIRAEVNRFEGDVIAITYEFHGWR